jgi:hypothetical protein
MARPSRSGCSACNVNPCPYPDSAEVQPPRRGEVTHALRVRVAHVDLPDEPAQTCGPLAALMLAHNWFGGRFVEARGRLGGQTTGHFLGIFKHVQRIHLTPTHRDHAVGLLITREAVVTAAAQ